MTRSLEELVRLVSTEIGHTSLMISGSSSGELSFSVEIQREGESTIRHESEGLRGTPDGATAIDQALEKLQDSVRDAARLYKNVETVRVRSKS